MKAFSKIPCVFQQQSQNYSFLIPVPTKIKVNAVPQRNIIPKQIHTLTNPNQTLFFQNKTKPILDKNELIDIKTQKPEDSIKEQNLIEIIPKQENINNRENPAQKDKQQQMSIKSKQFDCSDIEIKPEYQFIKEQSSFKQSNQMIQQKIVQNFQTQISHIAYTPSAKKIGYPRRIKPVIFSKQRRAKSVIFPKQKSEIPSFKNLKQTLGNRQINEEIDQKINLNNEKFIKDPENQSVQSHIECQIFGNQFQRNQQASPGNIGFELFNSLVSPISQYKMNSKLNQGLERQKQNSSMKISRYYYEMKDKPKRLGGIKNSKTKIDNNQQVQTVQVQLIDLKTVQPVVF